ncbi:uncharacterized protein K444DRAFT_356415 [Hyaloscypha bicolor E]|uniref:Uncharacterized protein n=1 Tax=Hyaloscypha bicolor E TaxID=1095630 RepID=A0A2J6TJ65_9HELO|nr:uncharacterized protein K444DRAFT_356415 [Hyaloscypha bicolor E]PMD63028.1 hypothetical protein K444DRAFT_356415 [Hyaloscypha bicolor E]
MLSHIWNGTAMEFPFRLLKYPNVSNWPASYFGRHTEYNARKPQGPGPKPLPARFSIIAGCLEGLHLSGSDSQTNDSLFEDLVELERQPARPTHHPLPVSHANHPFMPFYFRHRKCSYSQRTQGAYPHRSTRPLQSQSPLGLNFDTPHFAPLHNCDYDCDGDKLSQDA